MLDVLFHIENQRCTIFIWVLSFMYCIILYITMAVGFALAKKVAPCCIGTILLSFGGPSLCSPKTIHLPLKATQLRIANKAIQPS